MGLLMSDLLRVSDMKVNGVSVLRDLVHKEVSVGSLFEWNPFLNVLVRTHII